jgi:hypothetical protein
MRRIILSIALAFGIFAAQAQDNTTKVFNHMDLGVILGTTGFGFDVAMPVHDIVKLRAGFEFMPRFNYNMHFDVESFDGEGIKAPIEKMSEALYGLTGFKVNQNVTMKGKPTMWNFKFLVDVYPFKNKHWHVTAGFHWGPSKFAEAVNAQEDAPSLFAVGMYNHLWNIAWDNYNGIPTPIYIEGYDDDGTPYGPMLDYNIRSKLLSYGRMGIPLGKYKEDIMDAEGNVIHQKGETYYMQPNENSMVSAEARANSFKPYIGFGYEGRLIKGNDDYKIGFDAGLMFWGGTPDILTHDGTNLSKDVENINGKVGDYVKLIKSVKAFPVLNLRITRRIF